jgi:hypothetical protein
MFRATCSCASFFSAFSFHLAPSKERSMSWQSIRDIVLLAGAIAGLLATLIAIFKELRRGLLNVWRRALKLPTKAIFGAATLLLPNALIIGLLMHGIAIYYYDAGSLEFLITDLTVFLGLVGSQAVLVSAYSCVWGIFAYPRIRKWVCFKCDVRDDGSDERQN